MVGNANPCGPATRGDTARHGHGPDRPARNAAVTYGDPVPSPPESVAAAKALLRQPLIAARQARTEAQRAAARDAVAARLIAKLSGAAAVAGYLPLPTEPFTARVLDALVAAGTRVLVPVVTGAAPLDWCAYPAPLRTGAFGIEEPVGERLGAAAIREVDAVLVPALAVGADGHRLGRGGGHYDRTLALLAALRPAGLPERIAVVFDGEVLDSVPFDALDQRVSAVVTPGDGPRQLGPGDEPNRM
jgi:5-formyltetrahydrofolate cyclo-ligase